ncbi:MAG TPA: hypothetical protein VIM41_14765 [Gammaproteobacteria bacterium]
MENEKINIQHALDKEDRILLNLPAADQNRVIAKRQSSSDAEPVFIFNIVLRRAG